MDIFGPAMSLARKPMNRSRKKPPMMSPSGEKLAGA